MARMIPEDVLDLEKSTEIQKKVFGFIREAARPHADFICWHMPPVGNPGSRPDFILFGKKTGLLVLFVEDWSSRQIKACNPRYFTIVSDEKTVEQPNPDRQARECVDILKGRLSRSPEFLHDEPEYRDELRLPIGSILLFPNISREEYSESSFKWFIESERTFFREDLDDANAFIHDTSGKIFHRRVSKAIPSRFKGINQKAIDRLCLILWPGGEVRVPVRNGSSKNRFQKEVKALDESQARLALKIGKGHQIIKGPPGSGKTLILVHRCCQLLKYYPEVKRVLLVCYNIALVSYLRMLLRDKDVVLDKSGIQVLHFFELCSMIIGTKVQYENKDNEYYDAIICNALSTVNKGESLIKGFDAILVDEAQDFSNDMLRILLALLKPEGDFIIGLDPFQDLYRRKSSWKSLGINASGRTHSLKRVYRNSLEIFEFSLRFINRTSRIKNQMELFPRDSPLRGSPPEMRQYRGLDEMENFICEDISSLIAQREYKGSEIAIIYDDKVYGPDRFTYDNKALPMGILNRLERFGIPSVWVSRDVRTKEAYDITTDRVSLISIHSSKGLDFDLVYLVGIDHIQPDERRFEQLISLAYVAMTRARFRLVIPYVEKTELIKKIEGCLQ